MHNATKQGFTIVELLIVVIVIAVLASITSSAFNGVQNRSRNSARYSEMKAWDKTLKLYKATYGDYPSTLAANTLYCLGEGFPIGAGGVARCRDYTITGASSYLESDNAAVMAELRKVSSLPKSDRTPVSGTVGPYIQYYGSGTVIYRIYGAFNGSSAADCPTDTLFLYTSNGLAICSIDGTS